jgi:hypothetical protein
MLREQVFLITSWKRRWDSAHFATIFGRQEPTLANRIHESNFESLTMTLKPALTKPHRFTRRLHVDPALDLNRTDDLESPQDACFGTVTAPPGFLIVERQIHLRSGAQARLASTVTSGTGRCYSCDCRGYRKGKEMNWCVCGHHWDRHA